jgi:alpha-tubulin suppressor-like RCC1 family protein
VNTIGQLGLGDTLDRSVFTEVDPVAGWAQISAGGSHTLAISRTGALYGWGDGFSLGLNSGTNRTIPTRIGTANNWKEVSAGQAFSFAINTAGELYAFGSNSNGQTGRGLDSGNTNVPTRVGTDSDWIKVSAGVNHTLFIRGPAGSASGQLWACGSNSFGQIGTGTVGTNVLTPVRVDSFSNWLYISAGEEFSLGVRTGVFVPGVGNQMQLRSWGKNTNGQLGRDTSASGFSATTPNVVLNHPRFDSISAGETHSLAVTLTGSLTRILAWGNNANGRTGLGITTGNTLVPMAVFDVNDAVNIRVAAGQSHSIAVFGQDGVRVWGNNANGRTGLGITTGNTLQPTLLSNLPETSSYLTPPSASDRSFVIRSFLK